MATAATVLEELRALGTERTAATYRRHGARGEVFGVLFGALKTLARRLGRDQPLAEALWQSGNVDARTLATMIAEPRTIPEATLDAWLADCDYPILTDGVAQVAASSPHGLARSEVWRASDQEHLGRAGWTVVALLAQARKGAPDDAWLQRCLAELSAGLQAAPNRKRESMLNALIAIGGSREGLEAEALELARALGPVEIDHGDTACQTPDAVQSIEKMAARRRQKTKSR